MTKKKGIIIAIAGIIALLSFVFSGQLYSKKTKWSVNTIQVDNGWGYVISKNKSSLIHQKVIPAISERTPFKSQESAEAVGTLVLEKLQNGSSPGISLEELIKIGVIDSLHQPISK